MIVEERPYPHIGYTKKKLSGSAVAIGMQNVPVVESTSVSTFGSMIDVAGYQQQRQFQNV